LVVSMDNIKIKSFTNLSTWKEAHKLVLAVYKITKQFPKEEKYSLIDQVRRCSVSIPSNIEARVLFNCRAAFNCSST